MADVEKLTHGAEREGDSVRIPHNHPSFRFPRREDQQATAPHPEGVLMIVSQLEADQRKALGLPEEEPAAAEQPAQESVKQAQDQEATDQQTDTNTAQE